MLKDLFAKQRDYLDYFFETLDQESAEVFFARCLACKGVLFITGVGKSGIIAEKIAMTLVSTGTRALFLSPSSLLHGDLGVMSEQDLFIMLSRSGETEELLALIPFVRRKETPLLAVTSNAGSRLAKEAELSVALPLKKELCPFDLAPTTSTTLQLLFGDALAVALMQAKSFTLDAYALNHPAGAIGKKATLKVSDLMWKAEQIPLCRPDHFLKDTLVELSSKQCGCLLVADEEERLLGIFTDGDLRRGLQTLGVSLLESKMEALMQKCAIRLSEHLLAWEAIQILQKNPKRWVMVAPVLEGDKIVGILRMHDAIHAGVS